MSNAITNVMVAFVRPRSIAVNELDDKFVVNFTEAPMETPTQAMSDRVGPIKNLQTTSIGKEEKMIAIPSRICRDEVLLTNIFGRRKQIALVDDNGQIEVKQNSYFLQRILSSGDYDHSGGLMDVTPPTGYLQHLDR